MVTFVWGGWAVETTALEVDLLLNEEAHVQKGTLLHGFWFADEWYGWVPGGPQETSLVIRNNVLELINEHAPHQNDAFTKQIAP